MSGRFISRGRLPATAKLDVKVVRGQVHGLVPCPCAPSHSAKVRRMISTSSRSPRSFAWEMLHSYFSLSWAQWGVSRKCEGPFAFHSLGIARPEV